MTLTRRELRELVRRHGISPSKALGQHFVVDPNTVRRIARLAEVGPTDSVVEIGAGLGALTLALAETGAAVTALEVDRHLLGALAEVVNRASVRVVEADALRLDWDDLLSGAERWVLVANLPYNVATPLILEVLDRVAKIERMLVMVQREVGLRLVAEPTSADYGFPSLKVAYWAEARLVGRVPQTVFWPEPGVESVLVSIERRAAPLEPPEETLMFRLARSAFGQRRKMLRRSLATQVPPEVYEAAGVRPEARPEELGLEEWCRLAEAAQARGAGDPQLET